MYKTLSQFLNILMNNASELKDKYQQTISLSCTSFFGNADNQILNFQRNKHNFH